MPPQWNSDIPIRELHLPAATSSTPSGTLASRSLAGQVYAAKLRPPQFCRFNSATASPGFFLASSAGNGLITINPPSGPNIVNAQGVNDNGLVVGFYVSTDGQDHGFITRVSSAQNGSLSGTGVADPAIPNVAGEPGPRLFSPRFSE